VDRSLRDDRSFGPTKTTAAVRDVTVGPTVARTLAEHIATFGLGPDGLLFHDNGKALLRGQAGRVWKQAADGMGLRSRSGWHDLRHAHASTLLSEGVSIAAVSARLGHSSPTETLAAYAWAMPSDEQRIVDVTERAMRL
jgi:integrase